MPGVDTEMKKGSLGRRNANENDNNRKVKVANFGLKEEGKVGWPGPKKVSAQSLNKNSERWKRKNAKRVRRKVIGKEVTKKKKDKV